VCRGEDSGMSFQREENARVQASRRLVSLATSSSPRTSAALNIAIYPHSSLASCPPDSGWGRSRSVELSLDMLPDARHLIGQRNFNLVLLVKRTDETRVPRREMFASAFEYAR